MDVEIETIPTISSNREYLEDVPILDSNISYNHFFQEYLSKNQLCIIKNIGNDWFSTNNWAHNNALNYEYLRSNYAPLDVTVHDCKSHETKPFTFDKFLDYWKNYIYDLYPEKAPLYYLKDWHLQNFNPHHCFYKVPVYFASDWLNEYLVQTNKDDYRFVYMGPKNTWTPFHCDVFRSFSWSVNVYGKKQWIILPPGEENKLKDGLGNFPRDINPVKHIVKHFKIIQNVGDAVFVPSGWYHQVKNLLDTISINHNWINGFNIKSVWFDLVQHLEMVKKEIDDCKGSEGFLEQCQVVLKASYGMDFSGFFELIDYIGMKRVEQFIKGSLSLGQNHCLFDLEQLREVLELFVYNKDVIELGLYKTDRLQQINEAICGK